MSLNDEQLKELLKKWGDIEPKANFEANVWRRIRAAEAEQTERITVVEWLGRWLPQPAVAMAAAVVVSVIIGSSAGMLASRPPAAVPGGELEFLGTGTLAGGYAKLSTGGMR